MKSKTVIKKLKLDQNGFEKIQNAVKNAESKTSGEIAVCLAASWTTDAVKKQHIMRTVDKLDKIGADKVRQLLLSDCGLTDAQAEEILKFIAITGENRQVLAALGGYTGRSDLFDQGLSELNTVVKYLADFGVPEENFARNRSVGGTFRHG